VQTLDAFMREVERVRDSKENIYFCLSRQKETKTNGKGHLEADRKRLNATALRAIWLDIDVGPKKPYKTSGEALAALDKFLKDTGLPKPSAMVASGSGGFHAYWFSKTPLIPGVWQMYADALKALALQHGLHIDAGCTTDAARVLRVPGTLNWKTDPPNEVKLVRLKDDYDLSTFKALQGVAPAPGSARSYRVPGPPIEIPERYKGKKVAQIIVKDEDLPPDRLLNPLPILQGCGFLREAFTTGGITINRCGTKQCAARCTWRKETSLRTGSATSTRNIRKMRRKKCGNVSRGRARRKTLAGRNAAQLKLLDVKVARIVRSSKKGSHPSIWLYAPQRPTLPSFLTKSNKASLTPLLRS
jgi:hypothetical protein